MNPVCADTARRAGPVGPREGGTGVSSAGRRPPRATAPSESEPPPSWGPCPSTSPSSALQKGHISRGKHFSRACHTQEVALWKEDKAPKGLALVDLCVLDKGGYISREVTKQRERQSWRARGQEQGDCVLGDTGTLGP